MVKVVGVKFKESGKVYYFNPKDLDIHKGDTIVVQTAKGIECAIAYSGVKEVDDDKIVPPLRDVVRIATQEDFQRLEDFKSMQKQAFDFCLQKIKELGLEMNLSRVEFSFDGSKITFFFTADGRIDFRELVKILAAEYHTRIELRQIGVRDECSMIGGLGNCGRPYCCSTFLHDFQSVSIKMAKEQGLALSPGKMSGACGRLMCCLKYEQESYEYLNKITPRKNDVVDCREGRGVVIDASVITGMLKVRLNSSPDGLPIVVNREDVIVVK